MRTDFELVASRLKEYDPQLKFHLKRAANAAVSQLQAVRDFSAVSCKGDVLYLIKSSQLPELPPQVEGINLLCIEDSPVPAWLLSDLDCNLIVLAPTVEEEQIRSVVLEIYNAQRNFAMAQNKILDALYYGKGLQAISDIGSELFGNPVLIQDASFGLLAIPKTFPIRTEGVRKNVEQGYLDDHTLQFLKGRGWPLPFDRSGAVTVFSARECAEHFENPPMYGWYSCTVKVNGIVAANICIFGESSPFFDYHQDWMMQLAKITSIELQKNKEFLNNHGAMYEALLTDLLEERITDQLVILRRLQMLDRKIEKYLYVITVRKISNALPKPFSSIEQESLRALFPGSISVAYKGDAVLLVSSSDGSIPIRDDMEVLNHSFSLSGLTAGISNVFSEITQMQRYYHQSVKALEFGRSVFSTGGAFRYSDYAIYHALELCTEQVDLRDLCHPGVLMLQESSLPGDNDLFQTLYLYLLYTRDINRVSAAMNIHRSTLFYRLNKIKSIIGADLNDGNMVFQLMFSFKLIEYMDIFSPNETSLLRNSSGAAFLDAEKA